MIKKLFLILLLSFFLVTPVYADTVYSDPNGDNAGGWDDPPVGPWYTEINDAVRQPNTDSITSTWISDGLGNSVDFDMTDVDLSGGTTNWIKIWIYSAGTEEGDDIKIDLYINGAWQGAQSSGTTTTAGWHSVTFTGNWSDANCDIMVARLTSAPAMDRVNDYAMYAEVDYTSVAAAGQVIFISLILGGMFLCITTKRKGKYMKKIILITILLISTESVFADSSEEIARLDQEIIQLRQKIQQHNQAIQQTQIEIIKRIGIKEYLQRKEDEKANNVTDPNKSSCRDAD